MRIAKRMYVANGVVWRVIEVTGTGCPVWRADDYRKHPDTAWGWGYTSDGPSCLGIDEETARRFAK